MVSHKGLDYTIPYFQSCLPFNVISRSIRGLITFKTFHPFSRVCFVGIEHLFSHPQVQRILSTESHPLGISRSIWFEKNVFLVSTNNYKIVIFLSSFFFFRYLYEKSSENNFLLFSLSTYL